MASNPDKPIRPGPEDPGLLATSSTTSSAKTKKTKPAKKKRGARR